MSNGKILFLNFTIIGVISFYFYYKIINLEKLIFENENIINELKKENKNITILNNNIINEFKDKNINITLLNNNIINELKQENIKINNILNELNNKNKNTINDFTNRNIINDDDSELLNDCYDNIPCNNVKKQMSNRLWNFVTK